MSENMSIKQKQLRGLLYTFHKGEFPTRKDAENYLVANQNLWTKSRAIYPQKIHICNENGTFSIYFSPDHKPAVRPRKYMR